MKEDRIEKLDTVLNEVKLGSNDTGSLQVQIIELTKRIYSISNHISENHKDNSAKRGLMLLLGQRRRFLNYFKKRNKDLFTKLYAAIKG